MVFKRAVFPCTEVSSNKVYPCSATLAEGSHDFSWTPRTGTEGTFAKPPFYKTTLCSLSKNIQSSFCNLFCTEWSLRKRFEVVLNSSHWLTPGEEGMFCKVLSYVFVQTPLEDLLNMFLKDFVCALSKLWWIKKRYPILSIRRSIHWQWCNICLPYPPESFPETFLWICTKKLR